MTEKEAYDRMIRSRRQLAGSIRQALDTLQAVREKFGEAALQEMAAEQSPEGEAIRKLLRLERGEDPRRN
jgi:hypothetical protein